METVTYFAIKVGILGAVNFCLDFLFITFLNIAASNQVFIILFNLKLLYQFFYYDGNSSL